MDNEQINGDATNNDVTIETDVVMEVATDDTTNQDTTNTTPTSALPDTPTESANQSTSLPASFDVFHWANEVDEMKNNVSVELFLFNKNYTPYRVRYSDQLTASVKALFMQEATGYIIKEADKGLECREYEKSDGEEKVIYRTKLTNVGRAETLIHLIEHEYRDIRVR